METKMELFDYQVEDADFLTQRTCAGLFSGMGTGKTRIALEACRKLRAHDKCSKVIVVGPPISLPMWKTEAEDHLDWHDHVVILKTGKTVIPADARVLICSYTIATTRRDDLRQWNADVLIMDESHAIKTPTAKRTQALIGFRDSIADSVDRVYFLTGTPTVRWSDDLYTFLSRACPDELRTKIGGLSLDKFRLRYCVTQNRMFGKGRYTKKVQVTVGNRNLEELNDMLFSTPYYSLGAPATRRELAEVWAAMPALTVTQTQIDLDLSADLRKSLKLVENMTMAKIAEDLSSQEPALATIRRELGLAKVKASISELTARVEEGNGPVLVGVWHRDVIDRIHAGLKENSVRVAVIDGRTSSANKEKAQDLWNGGHLDVLLAQTAAAGVSLNLQEGGHKIVEIEQDWSPAIQDQFRARLHRIGQAKSVNVEVWSSDTKLDKAISQIARRKATGHAAMMATG